MRPLFLVALLLTIAIVSARVAKVPKRDHNDYKKNPMRIVCYAGTWSVYHQNEPFKIENIDAEKCTHLMYGFAKINEYTYEMEVFDPFQDDNKHGYDRFNHLRDKNPNLSTLISLGGWYEGSEKYSDMARNPNYRKKFVESVLEFLHKYDFDGLDLDWEFPGARLGDPYRDKENYLSLIRELHAAFEPFGYLLTAALSQAKDKIDIAYNVPELNKLLDFMNIMTYDYHGGWEDFFGHNAPLYPRPDETDPLYTYFTVNYTMNYYISLGASRDKLVMGVPFYGRSWSMEDPKLNKLKDPAKGKSPAGFITGEEGVLGYNELCQMMQEDKEKWVTHYDEYYNAPYSYNGKLWIGHEDIQSLSCKLAFLKKLGIGGAMVWSLENDDFNAKCGPKNPLLNKVYQMINGDEKDSYECLIGTTTPVPTTPTTEAPTTPTTEAPTTPTTEAPTTPTTEAPTTPTTEAPTTPTTQAPTTPTTHPSAPVTKEPEYTTVIIDEHKEIHVKCFKEEYIPHPHNIHKYIVCEKIPKQDGTSGWWVFVMPCAIGTRWHDAIKTCIRED